MLVRQSLRDQIGQAPTTLPITKGLSRYYLTQAELSSPDGPKSGRLNMEKYSTLKVNSHFLKISY